MGTTRVLTLTDEEHLTEAIEIETTRVLKVLDQNEQLLPGIPDEVTLNCISTKLPWRTVYVLSLVSPAWQRAIRSRQVYDARIRSQSTETLVVLGHRRSSDTEFVLCSVQDKVCYQLPGIPQLEGVLPSCCNSVSLNGKIYVLGQMTHPQKGKRVRLWVLDLVGQRGWRNCADMQARRVQDFRCGVMHGKIYVFGGTDGQGHESESEMYDPDTNVWSFISPMKSRRAYHNVAALGEELYVYGGYCCTPGAHYRSHALPLEIYNPTKNEWRQVEPWSTIKLGQLFTSHGKLYGVRWDGIYVLDDVIEKNSWTMLHMFKDGFLRAYGRNFVAVGDELLDVSHHQKFRTHGLDICLRQSKGFGSTTKELVWEPVNIPVGGDSKYSPGFMCTVQL